MSVTAGDVAWGSLPNKSQLAVVIIARFSEPVVRLSIWTYIFYQLRWLDPSKPPETIVRDAAMLQTVFTLAQGSTAVLWGHLADSPKVGRKKVLLISLGGSLISTVAFGFIQNYRQAVFLRLIEGAVNGNTAMIRTMVSEIVKERRYQAKAFVLMPMAYNVAAISSPMVAGFLADLAGQYPDTFGNIAFLRRFPYAPPAIASGSVVLIAFLLVFFTLVETHNEACHNYDLGLDIASRIRNFYRKSSTKVLRDQENSTTTEGGAILETEPFLSGDVGARPSANRTESVTLNRRLPWRKMFTRNLCLTLAAQGIMEGHFAVYNTLWPSFLSDPVASPKEHNIRLPFHFVGGLGMPARMVAISLAFSGILGIPLQIFGYSPVVTRLGMLRAYRIFLRGYPLVYFLIPYLSLVPSNTPRPAHRDGPLVWLAIFGAQIVMMSSVSYSLPTQIALTNK
ncbi:Major facilitator superfamily multidrug transporter mfsB [Paramyrothecium foliicola]|nr:Major facilitator superfamily multidrug transporter mfsB [Paramyrothecium foliicola]